MEPRRGARNRRAAHAQRPIAIRGAVRNALPRWQRESLSPLSLGLSVAIDYQRREVLLARTLPQNEADFVLPMRINRLPMVRGMLNSTYPAISSSIRAASSSQSALKRPVRCR